MTTQMIPVPFRDTTLYVVSHDDQPFTPMKPIVEGMGLAWQGQHEKLNTSQQRFCIREILIQMPGDDQRRSTICMPLRKLPGWLMTIHPNKVKPEIRDTIIAYQNECDDVLWQHWSQGKTAVQDAPDVVHQPRLCRDMSYAVRVFDLTKDAFGKQMMVHTIKNLAEQMGLPTPDFALIGKSADQLPLEL